MKQMNELYNELKDVKNTIDWMDAHDTPDNYREVDEARYRVVGTMASIVDDLLDVTDCPSASTQRSMFNSRELSNLLKVLNDYLLNGQRVSVEDTQQLIKVVESMWYIKRLEDFKRFVENSMPDENASQEEWDNFYDMEWNISFGSHSVKIINGAVIYNGVLDALNEELA